MKIGRRKEAWDDIDQSVTRGNVYEFKRLMKTNKRDRIISDKDSAYFETFYACATKRPRELSHRFLKILLKTLCTKNVVHLLPELVGDLDLEGLLMVRKYCPVAGYQMHDMLEMVDGLLDANPLSKYLLINWDDPYALQFTKSANLINPLIADLPDDSGRPRKFDQRGLLIDNYQYIKRLDRTTLFLQYHNILAAAEHMPIKEFSSILPIILGFIQKDEIEISSSLDDLEARIQGSFTVAVLVDDLLHIWRRGVCTFVLITMNQEADVEEVLYPLGSKFKDDIPQIEYSSYRIHPDSVLVYCSGLVADEVQLHDILGITMYFSDDPEGLEGNFKNYISAMKDVNSPTSTDGLIIHLYHLQKNEHRRDGESFTLPRRAHRRSVLPRSFRIFSDITIDSFPLTDLFPTDPDSMMDCLNAGGRRGLCLLNDFKSEASFDDDDYDRYLLSSDDDMVDEETLFERRRWWFDSSAAADGDGTGNDDYDSSMSGEFFLPSNMPFSSSATSRPSFFTLDHFFTTSNE